MMAFQNVCKFSPSSWFSVWVRSIPRKCMVKPNYEQTLCQKGNPRRPLKNITRKKLVLGAWKSLIFTFTGISSDKNSGEIFVQDDFGKIKSKDFLKTGPDLQPKYLYRCKSTAFLRRFHYSTCFLETFCHKNSKLSSWSYDCSILTVRNEVAAR